MRRIRAARAMNLCPEVHQMLIEHTLNLTTLSMLQSVLNKENAEALLSEAAGKSKRELYQRAFQMPGWYLPEGQ